MKERVESEVRENTVGKIRLSKRKFPYTIWKSLYRQKILSAIRLSHSQYSESAHKKAYHKLLGLVQSKTTRRCRVVTEDAEVWRLFTFCRLLCSRFASWSDSTKSTFSTCFQDLIEIILPSINHPT